MVEEKNLKKMSSSVGMMTFPTEWKNKIHVPVTTNLKWMEMGDCLAGWPTKAIWMVFCHIWTTNQPEVPHIFDQCRGSSPILELPRPQWEIISLECCQVLMCLNHLVKCKTNIIIGQSPFLMGKLTTHGYYLLLWCLVSLLCWKPQKIRFRQGAWIFLAIGDRIYPLVMTNIAMENDHLY